MTNGNLPKAPPGPPELPQANLRQQLTLLAQEVAMDLEDLDVILTRKGISKDQYERILKNPFYKRSLQAEMETWHSGLNAEQRLKIQCAFLAERALPTIYARTVDTNEPFPAVNEAMKILMKGAGVGEKATQAGTGEKFLISINLGGDTPPIIHEVKTIEGKTDGDASK